MMGETFRDAAPTTAAQAATIILDGWLRIAGGFSSARTQRSWTQKSGQIPSTRYYPEFWEALHEKGLFNVLG